MFGMGRAPEPGGGVAEAFASVVAPAQGSVMDIGRLHCVFAPFGGPAELSFGFGIPFAAQKGFPLPASWVAQAAPDEVKQLM